MALHIHEASTGILELGFLRNRDHCKDRPEKGHLREESQMGFRFDLWPCTLYRETYLCCNANVRSGIFYEAGLYRTAFMPLLPQGGTSPCSILLVFNLREVGWG